MVRGVATWVSLATVVGVVYWSVTDFHAWVGRGDEAWPKFELPLAWQIGESAFVGAFLSGAIIVLAPLIRRLWRKWGINHTRDAARAEPPPPPHAEA